MQNSIKRYTLPDDFNEKFERYMEEEIDDMGRTQYGLDYDSKPEVRELKPLLLKLKYWDGEKDFYRNREEFCNEKFSPNNMIKILDFIMKQK